MISRRALALCGVVLVTGHVRYLQAQDEAPAPLPLIDVPFISQSEALCGGAAAAMVLRYWGERELSAEDFSHLLDQRAAGIRTDALIGDLQRRGWAADGIEGDATRMRAELGRGHPVLTLIEDRPSTFHYIVVLAWHARGVVFHDPARGPYRVMAVEEFQRRWRPARQWMATILPPNPAPEPNHHVGRVLLDPPNAANGCREAVSEGIRRAQVNDLEGAERTLASAVACPGAAGELAGVRVLQKQWREAAQLASAAVSEDPADTYAWKVLATSRFVQDDSLGALAAWNRIDEPRIDLVAINGLSHTRHRAAEHMLGLKPGDLLTRARFTRARRRLSELPAAYSTHLEYVPVPSALVEVRGTVAERPLFPTNAWSLAATGAAAAATREVRLTTGSLTGGGEQIRLGWRFWPNRRRVSGGFEAPAPWGGIWSVDAFSERQPFTVPAVPRAERTGGFVHVSDWLTGHLGWDASAGVDEWAGQAGLARVGGGVRVASTGDRIQARLNDAAWLGEAGFTMLDAALVARSSQAMRGLVFVGHAGFQSASVRTPMDLWWAGDTGQARPVLLRAHPVLDDGRLRVDRLGRTLVHGSLEAQHWWRVAGPVRSAVAAFGDAGRTGRMRSGAAIGDVDVGIGARLAVAGMSGLFSIDAAKGLRDGATALSIAYEP